MTLICSEGHSGHDELSCVRTFFRGKYPDPKAHKTRRGLPAIPALSPLGAISLRRTGCFPLPSTTQDMALTVWT